MARTSSQERWLKFFNDVVYNALAPVYDGMDWLTLGAWWRLVRRAVDYVPPGGRVLEIGFGPGKLHAQLARRADVCVGLDLAWGMCQFTQRRLCRAELPSRIIRGSVFALPFPAGTFDAVVSTFAFSGFPNGQAAMSEMARITKRPGRVVLIDIGQPADGNRVGTFWAHLWEKMGDFLHDQPALMQASGLDMINFEEFGPGKHIRAVVGCKL
ncbi:MAG: methyltransferase domain-containing protein [Chloroflexi bacterium]|nr:methyltransferase domain-containing protein [Chloroflexota bacterium]